MVAALLSYSPFIIILIHFYFGRLAGFPLTIGSLGGGVLVGMLVFRGAKLRVESGWFISALCVCFLLQLLLALYLQEFNVGAFGQFCFFLLGVYFIVAAPNTFWAKIDFLKYSRSVTWVAVMLGAFSLLQAVSLNLFDNFSLQSPFGRFSHPGPGGEIYSPLPGAAYKRPNSFYYEPSVLSWALVLMLSFILFLHEKFTWTSVMLVAAVFSTGALTGMIGVVLVLGSYYLVKIQLRNAIFSISMFILLLLGANALFEYMGLYAKLLLFFDQGTSTYYRLLAPLLLISDSLAEGYIWGHVLGDTSFIESRYYMVNTEGGSNTNIDNSFYYLSFYFGVPGIVASFFYLFLFLKLLVWKDRRAILFAGFFCVFLATGSVFSPNTIVLLFISGALIRCGRREESAWP